MQLYLFMFIIIIIVYNVYVEDLHKQYCSYNTFICFIVPSILFTFLFYIKEKYNYDNKKIYLQTRS
jgi:hypothetical protein